LAHVKRAAAFGGKTKRLTTVGDAPANVRFGLAVVDGNINIVDAGIQHSMQDAFRLAGRARPADARNHAAQF
jgi:hypothetical protein